MPSAGPARPVLRGARSLGPAPGRQADAPPSLRSNPPPTGSSSPALPEALTSRARLPRVPWLDSLSDSRW
jgi:hypothetical protein